MIMDLETIEEYVLEGREELKRVEHIIYVSLKYTRTTDVLRNGLLRFVSFFDIMVGAFMLDAQEKGLIEKIAKSPALCVTRLAEMHPEDKDLQQFVIFYFFLKNLLNSDYKRINEYRRHVGMVFHLEGNSTVIINIDNLETCEYYCHKFFNHSRKFFGFVKEDE
jgi:hypothetical protein